MNSICETTYIYNGSQLATTSQICRSVLPSDVGGVVDNSASLVLVMSAILFVMVLKVAFQFWGRYVYPNG